MTQTKWTILPRDTRTIFCSYQVSKHVVITSWMFPQDHNLQREEMRNIAYSGAFFNSTISGMARMKAFKWSQCADFFLHIIELLLIRQESFLLYFTHSQIKQEQLSISKLKCQNKGIKTLETFRSVAPLSLKIDGKSKADDPSPMNWISVLSWWDGKWAELSIQIRK